MTIQPGLEGVVSKTVEHHHLSVVLGSGEVPVLATPQALAWCEEATMLAISDCLAPHETTVGMRVTLDHVRPSSVGEVMTALATVEKIDGRRVTFAVLMRDQEGNDVAFGSVVRVVVDRDRFLRRTAHAEGSL